MTNPVKSFSVGYNPINESNVFSSGDHITGQVTLELGKDCKIDLLYIKMKGKAKVSWVQNYGRVIVVHRSKEKYFSIKQFIIQEGQGNSNVSKGSTVYPFTFQIPIQCLPSTFKGEHGKIKYKLEANLSRSMRADTKASAEFTMLSKGHDPSFMMPQQGMTDKKMKLFASGTVNMDVRIDRTGFHQGEGIKVVASIQNKSSRDVTPKFCLYRKHSYFADKTRKVVTKTLLKEVGEAIPPSACQTVTRIITIPPDTDPSVLNCNILRAEHRLKVCIYSFQKIFLISWLLQTSEVSAQNETFFLIIIFLNSQNPPPYSTYGMYPTVSDFGGKS
uniref:Arrestin C-terminal-like domain-containing protein n=1 Tax=Sphaeramia orbicularis TaxID=375764 RepID=A0A673CM96_9TELE